MPSSQLITAEELLLDDRFLDWARGFTHQPGFEWVEQLRMRSETQELEVLEAFNLFQQLVLQESCALDASDMRARLLDRLDREPVHPISAKKPHRQSLRYAVVLGLLIVATAAYFSLSRDNGSRNLAGDGRMTMLEDGTRVQLTPQSTITFQDGFSGKSSREVWVKGEAVFQVKHTEDEKPFRVHTDAFDIEVTGTRFVVRNEPNEVSVLLQEGAVNLHFADGSIEQMKPGDYFSINVPASKKTEVESGTSKLERHIVFENTPILQVVREIETRYAVKVEILSPALRAKQITGILPNDNLQILLRSLEVAMDCVITQDEKNITIK